MMPMGLSKSPVVLQSNIYAVLNSIPEKSEYLAIMDDVSLHSCSKHSH